MEKSLFGTNQINNIPFFLPKDPVFAKTKKKQDTIKIKSFSDKFIIKIVQNELFD